MGDKDAYLHNITNKKRITLCILCVYLMSGSEDIFITAILIRDVLSLSTVQQVQKK